MKILLDHNLDWRLGNQLSGHDVRTALEMAWDTLKNGALLTGAERVGFSVLITSDKGIKDQQYMKGRSIGVVIIRAPNNRLETHLTMIPQVTKVGSPWVPPTSTEKLQVPEISAGPARPAEIQSVTVNAVRKTGKSFLIFSSL